MAQLAQPLPAPAFVTSGVPETVAEEREMDILVRPLQERDLPEADRILRLAFGTFFGLPDPMTFAAGIDLVRGRWRTDPSAALAAEVEGQLAGSNFVTNWGSVGYFGPLSVRPDLWDKGIASRLLERTMALLQRWGTRHAGLFTFPQSPKHVGLYQKFGFWPRFLTPVMAKEAARPEMEPDWSRYSDIVETERGPCLEACRSLTGAIYEGLDVSRDVLAVARYGLGDTVLLWDGRELTGLAVCHCGQGTEAGKDTCFVKFGVARGAQEFEALLDACETLAAARGLSLLQASVNTARHDAYQRMLARGFRTGRLQGVTMHRPNEPGYSRPDVYAMDDWR